MTQDSLQIAAENRAKLRKRLQNTHFDVAVIGGGISGAWITHLLSEAGYRCALLERKDFASETSSSSSKLLHGGIRYLQQMDFGKVRESTLERAQYLSHAPHIANAVPFIVPTFNDLKRSKAFLSAGMLAYKTLGIGQGKLLKQAGIALPRTQILSASALNSLCNLEDLEHTGAVVFPEFHLYDSERTVWALIESARQIGATPANYTQAESLLTEQGHVTGIQAKMTDNSTPFNIRAKLVVNAAGPWVDRVTSTLNGPTLPALINGYATGAHLITRQLVRDHAIAITTQQKSSTKIDRGGRHIFVIPWRGLSLIGTSYRETNDPDDADLLTQDDMDQLLDAVNDALPQAKLKLDDIISAYSGLYPLRVESIKSNEYQGTGEYLICDHGSNHGLNGLITSLGAKFTTGRKLGELTTSMVKEKLPLAHSHPPEHSIGEQAGRLYSARYGRLDSFRKQQLSAYSSRFCQKQIEHWIHCYGSNLEAFINFMDNHPESDLLLQPIIDQQPDVLGQIAWAVEHEMALHLDDALFRRTSIGLLGLSKTRLQTAADLMGRLLSWSEKEQGKQIQNITQRQDAIDAAARNYYEKQ